MYLLFRVTAPAHIDRGSALRFGQLDVGEDLIVHHASHRKLLVLHVVVGVQREEPLLFELAKLLVSRGITVGLGRLQPLLGELLCFGFDLAAC